MNATHSHAVRRFRPLSLMVAGLLLAFALGASAQPPQREDRKPTNLKVLDTTMTHDQVIAVMRKFTQALGVGCEHCHAAPPPGERDIDFASDDNKIKLTARRMMEMTGHINNDYLANLPAVSDTGHFAVRCLTCHHGQPQPVLIEDVLMRARTQGGMAALDSTYRALRTEYYGGFTYDFSDPMLAVLALKVADNSMPDALAILKLNKEFNPNSYVNEYAYGRIYVAQADTAAAIAAYKHALELNPDFRAAQHELQMLEGK